MNWNDWETALLALMMWRESRSQGNDGMRAVGMVAWNRHILSKRSLGLVITDDAQFTSINPPRKTYDPQLDIWPTPTDIYFKAAMQIASEIVSGASPDITEGATFYYNPATSTSEWFRKVIVGGDDYQLSARIGAHDFYRPRGDRA